MPSLEGKPIMALDTVGYESAQDNDQAGSWLSTPGDYQDLVSALSTSDPRLRHRDPKALAQQIPWNHARARVVTLTVRPEDGTFGAATELRSAASLERHLASLDANPPPSPSPSPRRNVHILEGLNPAFVSVLGNRFGLDPAMFLEHERVVVMNRRGTGQSDGTALPSVTRARDFVCLRYYELLAFDKPLESFRLVCGDTGRHIGVCWSEGNFTEVGIIRRKCTLWTRDNADGGWDCKFFFYF